MEPIEYEVHFSSSLVTIPGLPECLHDICASNRREQRGPSENTAADDTAKGSAAAPLQ